ncbi:transcriptional corepressor SEUSS isoform X1 [Ricinus communis]|uniref:Transcriptional corepressor SEUSS, putative n=1 Tax=Ricinus communis TaxID=3988 RepID=B9SKW2_RICCO|nr:transcriptional corepressor SEUSS isoform X1 [Ricinus communis]XP_025014452.1 transcriptional corepressor SEUSS isoform X1 [Ricinus communis]EEF35743.1 Transcriptional corepressor SEUSS, putative [Ricinus communis]|eukprot:XP_002526631.1 transcriptional corepressor SEUSS isoform X1 [Ricinus communis]
MESSGVSDNKMESSVVFDNTMESTAVSGTPSDVRFVSSFTPTNMINFVSSGQFQSQRIPNPSRSFQQKSFGQPFELQRFQHCQQSMQQNPVFHTQSQQQQLQFQSFQGGSESFAGSVNLGRGLISSNISLSGLDGYQQGRFDTIMEPSAVSMASNDVGSVSPFTPTHMMDFVSSEQFESQKIPNPFRSSQQQSHVQQFKRQRSQHGQQSMQHFRVSQSEPQQQQPQFLSIEGGFEGFAGSANLEPGVIGNQIGLQTQLHSLQSLGPVVQEPQQNQTGRAIGPVQLENQDSKGAPYLQQQQYHFPQISREFVSQLNPLQQKHILQQQQMLRAHHQQQPQLHQQSQQQNVPIKSAVGPVYEQGKCSLQLIKYMYLQQHRPMDNNIEFWQKFVLEFFTHTARKRLCVSKYQNRNPPAAYHKDSWDCELCNQKHVHGYESTAASLPNLFQIKYEWPVMEELLYIDMPHESQNSSGQIVLCYPKAIEESVFENGRVVRYGKLRIVFSPNLKICSWEFCLRNHEELFLRRLIKPQACQLVAKAQKYQASDRNAQSDSSQLDLERNCNLFLESAHRLNKSLEIPLHTNIGYTERYIRYLKHKRQISQRVNSMKEDFSCETGKGLKESFTQLPSRSMPLLDLHFPIQLRDQQQTRENTLNNDYHSVQTNVEPTSTSSDDASAGNSCSTTPSVTAGAELLHQNSMDLWIENQHNNPGSPYPGTPVYISYMGSSTIPQAEHIPSSFSSSTPSSKTQKE